MVSSFFPSSATTSPDQILGISHKSAVSRETNRQSYVTLPSHKHFATPLKQGRGAMRLTTDSHSFQDAPKAVSLKLMPPLQIASDEPSLNVRDHIVESSLNHKEVCDGDSYAHPNDATRSLFELGKSHPRAEDENSQISWTGTAQMLSSSLLSSKAHAPEANSTVPLGGHPLQDTGTSRRPLSTTQTKTTTAQRVAVKSTTQEPKKTKLFSQFYTLQQPLLGKAQSCARGTQHEGAEGQLARRKTHANFIGEINSQGDTRACSKADSIEPIGESGKPTAAAAKNVDHSVTPTNITSATASAACISAAWTTSKPRLAQTSLPRNRSTVTCTSCTSSKGSPSKLAMQSCQAALSHSLRQGWPTLSHIGPTRTTLDFEGHASGGLDSDGDDEQHDDEISERTCTMGPPISRVIAQLRGLHRPAISTSIGFQHLEARIVGIALHANTIKRLTIENKALANGCAVPRGIEIRVTTSFGHETCLSHRAADIKESANYQAAKLLRKGMFGSSKYRLQLLIDRSLLIPVPCPSDIDNDQDESQSGFYDSLPIDSSSADGPQSTAKLSCDPRRRESGVKRRQCFHVRIEVFDEIKGELIGEAFAGIELEELSDCDKEGIWVLPDAVKYKDDKEGASGIGRRVMTWSFILHHPEDYEDQNDDINQLMPSSGSGSQSGKIFFRFLGLPDPGVRERGTQTEGSPVDIST